jgi:hypothetical protein
MTKEAITDEQISILLQVEHAFRKGENIENSNLINPYWKPFIEVLKDKSQKEHNWKD